MSDAMVTWPKKDRFAEALAARIVNLTQQANREIEEYREVHDHDGIWRREVQWRSDVLLACETANQAQFQLIELMRAELADVLATISRPIRYDGMVIEGDGGFA